LRIIYFGSSDFSVPFLEKIDDSHHIVTAVFTFRDTKRGRGRKLMPCPVKKCALRRGLVVHEISKSASSLMQELELAEFDRGVVVSFGMIFPPELFERWPGLLLNVHPSMLPAYRGPSPITGALLDGAKTTGVTINDVVRGVDEGDIYAQTRFNISDYDNSEDVGEKAVRFGGPLLLNVLNLIEDSNYKPGPQNSTGATYTRKIRADDLKIDWKTEAGKIINRIKAFSPSPGAYTFYRGFRIKILRASVSGKGRAGAGDGEIIHAGGEEGLVVNCGEGAVRIETIQPGGRKAMDFRSFLNGYRPEAGSFMGNE
jgi:methionyl-tRNA formyltransferase